MAMNPTPNQITESDDEVELCGFYKELAEKQEPLGEEFEKVLYENIEELYIDSE